MHSVLGKKVFPDEKIAKHNYNYSEKANNQGTRPGRRGGLHTWLAADVADSPTRTGLGASAVILQVVAGAALEAFTARGRTNSTVRSALHTAARWPALKDKAVIARRASAGARTRTG